jgi:hypothetical protein
MEGQVADRELMTTRALLGALAAAGDSTCASCFDGSAALITTCVHFLCRPCSQNLVSQGFCFCGGALPPQSLLDPTSEAMQKVRQDEVNV